MLEFLLSNHPLDCPVCDKGGECELQDMTFRYGLDHSRFDEEKLHYPEEKWSPLVYYDAPRCILCFRCVRVCDEGMDVKALGVGARGVHSVILPNTSGALNCEECGACIDICPVGALTSGTYRYQTRPWEMTYVGEPCVHCSNGCKTTLSVRNNEILRANNRDQSGINGEFLCGKGRFGFDFTNHAERIRQPLIRRNGKLEPASWEDAFEEITRRLKQVRDKSGASAIGVIGSNHTTNEENYLLNRFARLNLGTNNLDHHRTADYAGLATALGANALPAQATMADIYAASTIFVIGTDPSQQNPFVAWQIRPPSAITMPSSTSSIRNRQSSSAKPRSLFAFQPAPKPLRFTGSPEAKEISRKKSSLNCQNSRKRSRSRRRCNSIRREHLRPGRSRLITFGSRLQASTRLMALGDYANSRGAAHVRLSRPSAGLCHSLRLRRALPLQQTLGR